MPVAVLCWVVLVDDFQCWRYSLQSHVKFVKETAITRDEKYDLVQVFRDLVALVSDDQI